MSLSTGSVRARIGQWPDDIRGALLMILGGLCFTLGGATVKYLAGVLPEMVVAMWRHVFALILFTPFVLRHGVAAIRTQRYLSHFWRGLFGFVSFLGFVYALPRLHLADVTALSFTTPLWALLISVALLGERVPGGRWIATAVGFGGVLLVARPSGDIEPAMLTALGSALFTSLAMMKVKQLAVSEPPDRITFYFLLNGLFISLPLCLPVWRWPDGFQLLLMLGIGVTSCLGQMCISRGYAIGQFTKMAPMDFTRLPLAILLGFVFFGELPDLLSVAGMVVIVGASLFILLSRTPIAARSR